MARPEETESTIESEKTMSQTSIAQTTLFAPDGPSSRMTLRDYQEAARDHVLAAIARGERRMYYSLPTGTGKSAIAGSIVAELSTRGRVLLVAHREELVTQLAAACERWVPGHVGIVMASRDEYQMPVVVASIQSLHAKRISRVLSASHESVAALIYDEAHHATATSYRTLIRRVAEHSPDVAVIGCTATPYRADKDVLQSVLPSCVFERDIASMQEAGWLAPLVVRQVRVPMHLADMLFSHGAGGTESDYDESALALDALRPEVLAALVEGTRRYITLTNRPTVAFAVNVAHAQALAEAYGAAGVSAAAVWGDMPRDERRRTLTRWKSGEIQLVSNVGILTEGFDFPDLACIVMARPTASLVLYTQILGRGLRLAPGKRNCLLLEATAGEPDPRQITAGDVVPVAEASGDDLFQDVFEPDDADEIQSTDEPHARRPVTLTLLDPRHDATYRWTWHEAEGCYTIAADKWHTLYLMRDPAPQSSGLYRVGVRSPQGVEVLTQTGQALPLRMAQRVARRWLDRKAILYLAGKEQGWHEAGITAKQIAFLRKHAPERLRPGLTAGEASQAINAVIIGWNAPQVREVLWDKTGDETAVS